jgi:hypothetical protein
VRGGDGDGKTPAIVLCGVESTSEKKRLLSIFAGICTKKDSLLPSKLHISKGNGNPMKKIR